MNDQNPTPPDRFSETGTGSSVPPYISSAPSSAGAQALGMDANERLPIQGVITAVEALLRQPRRVMYQIKQPNSGALVASLLAIAVLCSVVYGLVVGTFSGAEQLWAAPVKITMGLLISALICLPSLYIFSCLGGSQARIIEVFGLVAGLLALMTILLIGFAPVAWVFSQSTQSLVVMGMLHLVFWLIATFFGLRFLRAAFSHVNVRSYSGLRVWTLVFLLVALQMSTALRPIVGRADTFLPKVNDKKFFIGHWLDNLNSETGKAKPAVRD